MILMVMDSDHSPSRAGVLPLVGDNLALDFANTESGRGFASHQNHLRDATNVLDWLEHARALSPDERQWLRAQASARAGLAEYLNASAGTLRSAIPADAAAICRGH